MVNPATSLALYRRAERMGVEDERPRPEVREREREREREKERERERESWGTAQFLGMLKNIVNI